jgi:hypothetical protein
MKENNCAGWRLTTVGNPHLRGLPVHRLPVFRNGVERRGDPRPTHTETYVNQKKARVQATPDHLPTAHSGCGPYPRCVCPVRTHPHVHPRTHTHGNVPPIDCR